MKIEKECIVVFVVFFLLAALFTFSQIDFDGSDETTNTTTTTTTTELRTYSFRVKWHYTPLMSIDPPGDLQLEADAVSGTSWVVTEYMVLQDTWYSSGDHVFDEGDRYYLILLNSWGLTLDTANAQLVTVGDGSHIFHATDDYGDSWATIWFEWVEE